MEVVERGKCLIDHAPVYGTGSKDGTGSEGDDNMIVGRQKKLGDYEKTYITLKTMLLLNEGSEQF